MDEIKFEGSQLHISLQNYAIACNTERYGEIKRAYLNKLLIQAKEASTEQPESIFWKDAISFLERILKIKNGQGV